LLLIENMVDELNSRYSSDGHMLELNFYLEGENHAGE
jgi:hypothetical protein